MIRSSFLRIEKVSGFLKLKSQNLSKKWYDLSDSNMISNLACKYDLSCGTSQKSLGNPYSVGGCFKAALISSFCALVSFLAFSLAKCPQKD